MEYRSLGSTGVQVSSLCFGTMSFGGDADEPTARALFERCRAAGINFFDTADVYTGGRSEEILGRLAAGCRDELVLSSKVHFPTGSEPNARGLSRRHIMLAVEASLRRLGTDRLDLYFAHGYDTETPLEETLRAFDDLVRQGKVLYPAASNWAAWQAACALGVSARERLAPLACLQPMYNLVKRQAEVEILPLAADARIGVVCYSPLGGGLLSGKYGSALRPESGRLVDSAMYGSRYSLPEYYAVADRFTEHARKRDLHPASLAIAWVTSHPAVSAAIIGARSLEQLEPVLAAASVPMTEEWRAEISTLAPEPPPATDRLEERRGLDYAAVTAPTRRPR